MIRCPLAILLRRWALSAHNGAGAELFLILFDSCSFMKPLENFDKQEDNGDKADDMALTYLCPAYQYRDPSGVDDN